MKMKFKMKLKFIRSPGIVSALFYLVMSLMFSSKTVLSKTADEAHSTANFTIKANNVEQVSKQGILPNTGELKLSYILLGIILVVLAILILAMAEINRRRKARKQVQME